MKNRLKKQEIELKKNMAQRKIGQKKQQIIKRKSVKNTRNWKQKSWHRKRQEIIQENKIGTKNKKL